MQSKYVLQILIILFIVASTGPLGLRKSIAETNLPLPESARLNHENISQRHYSELELEALLFSLKADFRKIKTLKASFIQEKYLSLFSEKIISKGLFFFQSPDRLRLEFTEPFKSSLSFNEGTVTKFEFLDGKWKKLKPGNQEAVIMIIENITSWLQGEFRKNNLYNISAREGLALSLFLTPKDPGFRKYIACFELGINKERDGLDSIKIWESGEDYTKISFQDETVNSTIPGSIFDGIGLKNL